MTVHWNDVGAACLSAGLLLLAFPAFDIESLAWVGLVPLLLALDGTSLKEPFVCPRWPACCRWIFLSGEAEQEEYVYSLMMIVWPNEQSVMACRSMHDAQDMLIVGWE